MVTLSIEIVAENIRRFVDEVQHLYDVRAVYLFGSQVMGEQDKWSDIDLLVVSPDFRADRQESRLALMRIARQIDARIEPHPMSPEDFNESNPLAYEVKHKGIRISIGLDSEAT